MSEEKQGLVEGLTDDHIAWFWRQLYEVGWTTNTEIAFDEEYHFCIKAELRQNGEVLLTAHSNMWKNIKDAETHARGLLMQLTIPIRMAKAEREAELNK